MKSRISILQGVHGLTKGQVQSACGYWEKPRMGRNGQGEKEATDLGNGRGRSAEGTASVNRDTGAWESFLENHMGHPS